MTPCLKSKEEAAGDWLESSEDEKKKEEEEEDRATELLLLEALALFEKELRWARRCQAGTAALAAAFPAGMMMATAASAGLALPPTLQFLLGAAWAGLALTAVVLLQERINALIDVGVGVKNRIRAMAPKEGGERKAKQ